MSVKAVLHAICLALIVSAAPTAQSGSPAEQRIARRFERIRRDPPALRAFLRAMPKGADLHTHLSGAVYAESYVRWAAELDVCVDSSTLAFVVCNDPGTQRPAQQALQDPALYRRLIDAFSTRHWDKARTAGHYQFFDAFQKFGGLDGLGRGGSAEIIGQAVAEVMHRAAIQNVLHIELMTSMTSEAPASDRSRLDGNEDFSALREWLLGGGLRQRVAERRQWLDAVEARARATLRCGTASASVGCDISLRFVPYALRGLPPPQVFAQALFAFELAVADRRVAGVNLVMPEDWFVPMRDYDLHMRMFRFLRTSYPGVNVALHAGELALGLVPPETLGLHVRQAIEVGGAQRIGHGTDVMNDADPTALLRTMAARRIAVEISLSSSDVLLGIRGAHHPLRQYLRAGVPVVIATDDEGIARSDLTNEYQRAVEEQGLSYRELKRISRNSIEHSFLPRDAKAVMTRRLDAAFARFEAAYPGKD